MAFNTLNEDTLASGAKLDGISGVVSFSIALVGSLFFGIDFGYAGLIGGICGSAVFLGSTMRRNRKRAQQLRENEELRMEMAVEFSSTLSDIDDSSKLQEWNKIKLEIASSILTESNQRILERELIVKHTISETVNVSGVAEEKYGELYAEKLDMQKMYIELEKKLEMVEKENDDTRKELLAKESIDLAEVMKSNGFQFTIEQLIDIGVSAGISGNLELAGGYFSQALKTSLNNEDHKNIAKCLVKLGNNADAAGDLDEAERLYHEALKFLKKAPSRLGEEVGALTGLGLIAQTRGDLAEAERLFRESLTISREIGEVLSMNNLANVAMLQGDLAEAERLHKESLTISREEISDRLMEATSLGNLGAVAKHRGDLADAEQLFQESLVICREINYRKGEADSLNNLGVIAKDRGDLADAERLFRESLVIERYIGAQIGQSSSLNNLGLIVKENGYLDEAERLFQESLIINREINHLKGQATSLRCLVEIAVTREDFVETERLERECLVILRELDDREGMVDSLTILGSIAKLRGDLDESEHLMQEGLALKREIGMLVGEEE